MATHVLPLGWWYSCCSVSALSFTDAVWLWCTCVLRPQQDLARYKKHVLAVVAAANASRSEPLTAENVNAMVVEDRTPHLGQIEVGDVPGVCVGLAALGCATPWLCSRWTMSLGCHFADSRHVPEEHHVALDAATDV